MWRRILVLATHLGFSGIFHNFKLKSSKLCNPDKSQKLISGFRILYSAKRQRGPGITITTQTGGQYDRVLYVERKTTG